jgi:stress responsive alpha/beta barrel protein
MICHLVLFRPRPTLTDVERDTFIEAFSTALARITSIRRARVGVRVTHGRAYETLMREDFSHAAILEFEDLQALRAYLEHPAHERLGALLFESAEAVLVYDYEMDA